MKASIQRFISGALILCSIMILTCQRQVLRFQTRQKFVRPTVCYQYKPGCGRVINSDRFGIFSSSLWNDYYTSLFNQIQIFKVIPKYVLWYIQIDDVFPLEIINYNTSMGINTVINHDLKSIRLTGHQNSNLLSEIASGKWDKYFKEFASRAKKTDVTIYYRFGYEMNGNWFPWCEQPELYIQAYRHVWKLFDKEKAYNVIWIFSPSVEWDKANPLHAIEPYYPGDMYVDIIGLDGYNFGDTFDKYHSWKSVSEIFSHSLDKIQGYNKPMWITETGCPADPRRSAWLQELFTFLDNNCCLDVFVWFNEFKKQEPDFRIESDTASLQVFRDWISREYFDEQDHKVFTAQVYEKE